MKEVVVINYGSGNIYSIVSALNKLTYKVKVSERPNEIIKSDIVILPGVGSYNYAMNRLINMNINEALSIFLKKGGLLIGICLGYQVLFEESEEFGNTLGLGILKGKVVSLKKFKNDIYKIPNIGWRPLIKPNGFSFLNYKTGSMVYFVHSFVPVSLDEKIVSSYIKYGNYRIHSSIHNGQVAGFQFHPEKSGHIGLQIIDSVIKNF